MSNPPQVLPESVHVYRTKRYSGFGTRELARVKRGIIGWAEIGGVMVAYRRHHQQWVLANPRTRTSKPLSEAEIPVLVTAEASDGFVAERESSGSGFGGPSD